MNTAADSFKNLDGYQLTPLMQQYWEIKSQFQDSLLFFQVGDFYELFFQDAQIAAKELAITLTSRGTLDNEPIPLCGVPCHAADYYVIKLAKAGFKVIICDQLEEAQQGKIVRRGVSRVITPGTMTDSVLLAEKKSSYLMVLTPQENGSCSLLVAEIMTGMLWTTTVQLDKNFKYLQAELVRFTPDEIIIDENNDGSIRGAHSPRTEGLVQACKLAGYMATLVRKTGFDGPDYSEINYDGWRERFKNSNLVPALHTFYRYMYKYQSGALEQFKDLKFYSPEDYLYLDAVTQKTLEIVEGLHGDRTSTLFKAIDETVTPMGARLLRRCLTQPLKNLEQILARQSVVNYFVQNLSVRENLRDVLKKLPDFERVVGRCLLLRGNYNDYQALKDSLKLLEKLNFSTEIPNLLESIVANMADFGALINLLDTGINEGKIGDGFDLELDIVRKDLEAQTTKLLEFEQQEKLKTGIGSLKVVYNQVHGYLIEVTNSNLGSVPEHYEPYQRLSGRERFTLPELRLLEQRISQLKRKVESLEKEVFARIISAVVEYARPLRLLAQSYAQLDMLSSLAHLAATRSYVCPELTSKSDLIIKDGRHPVIEKLITNFVPNSLNFSGDNRSVIITGPNMGGKSTYLRQVALTVILGQVGSFVPASAAQLPLLDMICTRIGTGDNLKEGKSTFLIEMEETAAICQVANENTLVLLDEVGRGTSTQDGVALARAIAEYLHSKRCMLMFATHYQELTALESSLVGVRNMHVTVEEIDGNIVFLHNIEPGTAKSSFGVEVAKLAGMPKILVDRAYELLNK